MTHSLLNIYLKNNDLTSLKKLFSERIGINYRTSLHELCWNLDNIDFEDNHQTLKQLIQYLASKLSTINVTTIVGNTPLHFAIMSFNYMTMKTKEQKYGIIEAVRTLLDLKASTNMQNSDGKTPLEAVIRCGDDPCYMPMVWLLLEYGAELPKSTCREWTRIEQMMQSRTDARKAALTIVGIKRYKRSSVLRTNNNDIARLIAQMIWQSRRFWPNVE